MSLKGEIDNFQMEIRKIVNTLEGINRDSSSIPETREKELSSKFASLMNKLNGASSQLNKTKDLLKQISNKWGK